MGIINFIKNIFSEKTNNESEESKEISLKDLEKYIKKSIKENKSLEEQLLIKIKKQIKELSKQLTEELEILKPRGIPRIMKNINLNE